MRINIDTLEQILSKLKCKFADNIYSSYIKEQYAFKGCKDDLDIDEIKDYILIMEEKIKLLKWIEVENLDLELMKGILSLNDLTFPPNACFILF